MVTTMQFFPLQLSVPLLLRVGYNHYTGCAMASRYPQTQNLWPSWRTLRFCFSCFLLFRRLCLRGSHPQFPTPDFVKSLLLLAAVGRFSSSYCVVAFWRHPAQPHHDTPKVKLVRPLSLDSRSWILWLNVSFFYFVGLVVLVYFFIQSLEEVFSRKVAALIRVF